MDKYNIDTFFNVTYNVINNKPKITIKLKSKYKTKTIPSINGNSKDYYIYYLWYDLGMIAYDMIRPLMVIINVLTGILKRTILITCF